MRRDITNELWHDAEDLRLEVEADDGQWRWRLYSQWDERYQTTLASGTTFTERGAWRKVRRQAERYQQLQKRSERNRTVTLTPQEPK